MDGSARFEGTADLLRKVREGDAAARERLVARYLPVLIRWARGRLPQVARDLTETDDLVQVTLVRALDRVGDFDPRREGAFLSYLRRILLNSIRKEIRRATRKNTREGKASEGLPTSPVLEQVGGATVASYEAALERLPATHQEAIVLRVEFGMTFPEIAAAIGSPSADATRMLTQRALLRLAEEMRDTR